MSATGYRIYSTGALTNVGTNGYYWSSSPFYAGNNNAGYLNFNSGAVNPLNNANRSNGFAVRCVQHLRALFCRYGLFDTLMSIFPLTENSSATRNDEGHGFCQRGR